MSGPHLYSQNEQEPCIVSSQVFFKRDRTREEDLLSLLELSTFEERWENERERKERRRGGRKGKRELNAPILNVCTPCESVTDDHTVVLVVVEFPPGLVGDGNIVKSESRFEREGRDRDDRLRRDERGETGGGRDRLVRRGGSCREEIKES